MANKKKIAEMGAEEIAVEEIIETDINLAEIEENEPILAEEVVAVEPVKDEVQAFINRKLKAINTWSNPAKQKRAIEGLFRIKRGN